MSLIDKYTEYAEEACDAPRLFHRAVAYWIVSTLLGRYAVVVTTYRPKGIKPNLWVLLIGPSRLVRKSTAMDLGAGIVEQVDEKLLLPSSFSPEALYETLSTLERGDAGTWVKDEMGGFFKSLQKRYMAETREILSSIYMGKGQTRKLRSGTFKIPDGLYITSLGTAPWPSHLYMNEEDFRSGFMNRYIIAFAKKREKTIDILNESIELEMRREEITENFRELCGELSQRSPVTCSFSADAAAVIREYEEEVESEIERLLEQQPDSLWISYLGETPNHLLKMAVCRRLADPPYEEGILVVRQVHAAQALADLRQFLNSAREVVLDVQSSPRAREVLTEEKALSRVFEAIRMRGADGIKMSELLMETRILKAELVKYLETLIEQERIIAVKQNGEKKRGRRAIYFFAKEFERYAVMRGKVLDLNEFRVLI